MDKLLEAEELTFLAELMARESGERESLSVQLPQASPLIALLGQAQCLDLVARFEHHLLRFPVHLQVNDSLHPEMIIDAPEILESGPINRKWRFRPQAPLRILDQNGNDSGFNLLDLSDSSLSISDEQREGPMPTQMNLQLELPDTGDLVPLSAKRVRELAEGVAAYQLELKNAHHSESLRWYLLNQHPSLSRRDSDHENEDDLEMT